jgi:uncharacterized protein (UPF0548 family)
MWYFRKPSERLILDFLEQQRHEPFSYSEVGLSLDGTPAGYDLDHNRVILGKGRRVFEASCDALKRWEMFPGPWTRIEPPGTLIQEGNVVAMLAHVSGLWWLNACRILYLLDESEPLRRFGFAYGTLPRHVAPAVGFAAREARGRPNSLGDLGTVPDRKYGSGGVVRHAILRSRVMAGYSPDASPAWND